MSLHPSLKLGDLRGRRLVQNAGARFMPSQLLVVVVPNIAASFTYQVRIRTRGTQPTASTCLQ